jgi:nitric oxide dioxygenase
MTPQQTKLVADSFERIKSRLPQIGAMLYARLFEIAPDARALFKDDMKAQEAKLMEIFSEFARAHSRSRHFLPVTESSGHAIVPGIGPLYHRHVAYGVREEHYAKMREAMMWALSETLKDDFPPEVMQAWNAMFDMLAKSLREASASDPLRSYAAMGPRFEAEAAYNGTLDEFLNCAGERDSLSESGAPERDPA